MLERIVRGDYTIGQVISRRRIAADLGISFLPTSEAFLRLEYDGLLESRPRAGTRIRIPSRQDVEGHFTVREALEVQAAMLFAERSTSQERAEVIQLASRLDHRARRQHADPIAHMALHESLHLKIGEYTRCIELETAIRKQSALSSAWLAAMKTAIGQDGHAKHEPLARAVARQKPAAAGETMRAHLRAEMEDTLSSLDPYFETNKKFIQTYSRPNRRRPSGGEAAG